MDQKELYNYINKLYRVALEFNTGSAIFSDNFSYHKDDLILRRHVKKKIRQIKATLNMGKSLLIDIEKNIKQDTKKGDKNDS